ncbi:MAG: NTP transferase domain-containing protein [Candidatus Doudnabacteria bacterium]|nr:NTP transferase domain-containing protein [Candidatus Doudnabacteria bacterium]
MTNQFVVLAAGKGTRMGGDMPKVLVGLKSKPLILHLLHELEKINQLIKPVVVVGYQAEKVRAVLGDDYLFAYQSKQLGTAHALLAAKEKVRAENILVLYGDMPFIRAESLRSLMKLHRDKAAKISMLTSRVESFQDPYNSLETYGRIIREPQYEKNKELESKIVKIVEYKDATEEERKITEVNPGIYMFNTEWLWPNLEKIKNGNAQSEYYLTDIVALAIGQNVSVSTLSVNPKEVLGVNTPEHLEVAKELV